MPGMRDGHPQAQTIRKLAIYRKTDKDLARVGTQINVTLDTPFHCPRT